jgi:hypothetical protein
MMGMEETTFAAAATRPEGYPAGLPFVPRASVEIRSAGSRHSMSWYGVERAGDLVQLLVGASAAEGWVRATPGMAPVAPLRFVRGTEERCIDVVNAGAFTTVTLTQGERT